MARQLTELWLSAFTGMVPVSSSLSLCNWNETACPGFSVSSWQLEVRKTSLVHVFLSNEKRHSGTQKNQQT